MKKTIIFIIIILLLTTGLTLAQERQFRLEIDNLNLATNTSTNLVVSLKNAGGAELEKIQGLDDFEVLSRRRSSETRIVNGNSTHVNKLIYSIMPKETGEFTLQGIVNYQNQTYKTNKLKVSVNKNRKQNLNQEYSKLFVKTSLSQKNIYFGQKTVLTYELFSRYNLEQYGFVNGVSINGFMIKNIPKNKLKANYVYLIGKKYFKY